VNKVKTIIPARYVLLLFCIAAYLFIAVSHIFYLPHYAVDNTPAPLISNSIFKRQVTRYHHDPVQLQRTDKSTLEEKKSPAADIAQAVAIAFVLIYAFSGIYKLAIPSKYAYAKYSIYSGQYTYLTLRTFRI
jgi:hypothetical protein